MGEISPSFVVKNLISCVVLACLPLVLTRENLWCIHYLLIVMIWVDFGPVLLVPTPGRLSMYKLFVLVQVIFVAIILLALFD